MDIKKEKQWYNYPNVIFTGIAILYIVIREIILNFNN